MNELICTALDLDAEELWAVAQKEKVVTKYPDSVGVTSPDDHLIAQNWGVLTTKQKKLFRDLVMELAWRAD